MSILKKLTIRDLTNRMVIFERQYKLSTGKFVELYKENGPPPGIDHMDAFEWHILCDSYNKAQAQMARQSIFGKRFVVKSDPNPDREQGAERPFFFVFFQQILIACKQALPRYE